MGRTKNGRGKGCGTLEKRGDIWLARWVVNGKRFTRSTGCKISGGKKALDAARKLLEEYTHDYQLGDEKRILERQVARLNGVKDEIAEDEARKPALTIAQGWEAYRHSQSRPRSGAGTMRNYEQQYFIFADWLKEHHADATEMRQVSRDIANEYAQFLLTGTPKAEADAIHAARRYVSGFEYRRKRDGDTRELGEEAQQALEKRRRLAARTIREPLRGNTFNKHVNALALIWRHVSREEKARITLNPWGYDEETGEGIKRITLTHAERPHRRRALTFEEAYKLLQAAQGEMRVLIAVGVYTGLRLGDAVLLNWGNIDRLTGIITVRSRKTDTETRTLTHPALARILQNETRRKSGYVMPTLAQEYLAGRAGRVRLADRITALFNGVGIETKTKEQGRRARSDCGFHSLRHTFVSMLRAGGARLQTARELAGHRTERMTEHYTHDGERAVLALPDFTDKATAQAQADYIECDAATADELDAATSTGATVATPSRLDAGRADGRTPSRATPTAGRAHALTLDELRGALAGLTESERAELLRGLADAPAQREAAQERGATADGRGDE